MPDINSLAISHPLRSTGDAPIAPLCRSWCVTRCMPVSAARACGPHLSERATFNAAALAASTCNESALDHQTLPPSCCAAATAASTLKQAPARRGHIKPDAGFLYLGIREFFIMNSRLNEACALHRRANAILPNNQRRRGGICAARQRMHSPAMDIEGCFEQRHPVDDARQRESRGRLHVDAHHPGIDRQQCTRKFIEPGIVKRIDKRNSRQIVNTSCAPPSPAGDGTLHPR